MARGGPEQSFHKPRKNTAFRKIVRRAAERVFFEAVPSFTIVDSSNGTITREYRDDRANPYIDLPQKHVRVAVSTHSRRGVRVLRHRFDKKGQKGFKITGGEGRDIPIPSIHHITPHTYVDARDITVNDVVISGERATLLIGGVRSLADVTDGARMTTELSAEGVTVVDAQVFVGENVTRTATVRKGGLLVVTGDIDSLDSAGWGEGIAGKSKKPAVTVVGGDIRTSITLRGNTRTVVEGNFPTIGDSRRGVSGKRNYLNGELQEG
ncbi:MAG TPA: hypothetical protein VLF20_05060 [Patescibacteria group bacterium]|nr:hypothetical protein [Patescibacteria group bacterium]